ncbi:sensor histidine kinase [Geothrix sp. PMB-07]|uniref:sensor histidine kinase n=1 Tax=Geothrix sp. PMB-07 TaxID=3068640 RepID=UPI0027403320|nr:ATP-binding protein [Geothrix sp. PMB-07]WLT30769.1 ATP-binding protein [Geothrix sp. PMB-07]
MASLHPSQARLGAGSVLPALLAILLAYGVLLSRLPQDQVSAAFGLGLLLANGAALILLAFRSREPGPEQRGWRLLAASALVLVASNLALAFTGALAHLGPVEGIHLFLQLAAALLQAWALLSWPFRSSTQAFRRPLNLIGSLLCSLAILLLLWGALLYNPPDQGQEVVYLRMMALSARVAVVAGITVYFLAEDPRRVRGPLGWFMFGSLAWGATIVLAQPTAYGSNATLQPSALLGLTLMAPFTLILVAQSRQPVEVDGQAAPVGFEFVEWLIYLPFLAASLLLVLFTLGRNPHLLLFTTGFLGICALSLARHGFLLREARVAREELEDRVRARTHDLETLQATLRRTERMNAIATLGAGLAHDLNNALSVVLSSAELSRAKLVKGEPPNPSDMDRIIVAADQSAALTRRLMTFARTDQKPPGLIDLHHATADLESLLRMLLPRDVTLQLVFRDPITPILGSRDRIEQMLVNLVSNARDAMPQGGHIEVQLDRESDSPQSRIFLRVTDDGPGMPPDLLESIFKPFFTTKPLGQGTGLGLASVRYTMEELGGSVEVDSKLGVGTTFTLWFPPPA